MKYSFMSFSCPELDIDGVLAAAERFGYDGVELRLDAGHKHGVEVGVSPSFCEEVRAKANRGNVEICCLATSCRFADPAESDRQVKEALERIDLAGDLGVHRIRVFGGSFPEGQTREEAIEAVVGSLGDLADQARARDVIVCMETHDAWCDPTNVAEVMRSVNHDNIGVNWDLMHPVRTGHATIDQSFEMLGDWVKHVHFHDGVDRGNKLVLLPIGEGAVDHRRAIVLLKEGGYDGYLSGEWINWEPWEKHLPRELATMRAYEGETQL